MPAPRDTVGMMMPPTPTPATTGTEVILEATDARDWQAPVEPVQLPIALPSQAEERYEVRRELARGSMGIVRVALDRTLKREVALKVLNLERTETIEHAIKALDISVGPAPKAGHLTLA